MPRAALADDLERFAQGEPLSARPPDMLQRAAQWTRRHPALACRLAGLGVFYLVELGNYYHGIVAWSFHWKMTALPTAWAAVSVVCEWFVQRPRLTLPARLVWGTFDSFILLAALSFVADGAASGLIAVYPLLITASALWFRVNWSAT